MPKVSIIVPVYKAEMYLHRCIDSLLAQTFTDYEIILIDDSSPDSSGDICDAYAAIDKRIKVLHLLYNGGVSRARNKGLEIALGEWITFVDADDYLYKDFLQQMLRRGENTDLVIGGYRMFETEVYNSVILDESRRLTGNMLIEFYQTALSQLIMRTPWGKLFSRGLIEEHVLRFDTSLSLGEDTKFVLQYLQWVCALQIEKEQGYYYYCPVQEHVSPHRKFHLQVQSIAHFNEEIMLAYQQLSQKHVFLCKEFEQFIQDFSFYLFVSYQMDEIRKYKYDGYQDYNRFVHSYLQTEVCSMGGGKTISNILSTLKNKKLYFSMFLSLRFVFPFILDIKYVLRSIFSENRLTRIS